MTIYRPQDAKQLLDVMAWAVSAEAPLELVGHGTKRRLGRPLQVEHTLDLSALAGIRDYEASELVLTAGAATPLAEIEQALAARGQELAFEPPDWSALWGETPGRQTLGGVLAANLAGPRRIKAGAARDHFLGFAGVSGRGEAFKAGGKVVKNVTGYDLMKLMAGSWGTLAALAEVTVKVLPRAEKTRTVLVLGLDDLAAIDVLSRALGSPHEVSGAAHLPEETARTSSVSYVSGAGSAVTAIRVEGFGPSVEHRCRELREAFAADGTTEELHGHNSGAFWREVGNAAFFGAGEEVLWRVSIAPTAGPRVVEAMTRATEARRFYDWGGGLVWLAVSGAEDGGAAVLRAAVRQAGGGHATLVRGADPLRAAVPVFEPLADGVAALTRRVKEGFDPHGILNPGRMHHGM